MSNKGGVYWQPLSKCWTAAVPAGNGKLSYLGMYDSEAEAQRAYDDFVSGESPIVSSWQYAWHKSQAGDGEQSS